jgi:DNA-binding MarR family transcriptional regulator
VSKATPDDVGRFAYDGLDRVLHEKARLGIMTSLATRPGGIVFGELKALCNLTDGNLNRHIDVLVKAGFVELHKAFVNNRPQTTCKMTALGRRRFREYVAALTQVLRDAATAADENPARRPGWAAT